MDETPDPATGLTERQKDAVRDNWAKVAASWKTSGPDFFIRLFQAFPATRTFFKTLDGLDYDQMRTSSKLRAHAINFKHGITSMIDNLDDVECLVILINKLSDNHFRRQIQPQHFQDAFIVFTKLIQDVSDVDDFTLSAWTSTLNVVAKVITERMSELQKNTDGQ